MARIVLHGELSEKFAPEYSLDVHSPRDAVRALCTLVPNFQDTFKEGNYFIYVEANEHINIDENNFDFKVNGDIHIVPEVVGAKKQGLGKVLAGIALIGLSVVTGGAAMAAWAVGASTASLNVLAATTLAAKTFMSVGIGLVLGGASMMLAPKIKAQDTQHQQSYNIDGSDVNIQNGGCVPLVYGEVMAAGFPIAVEISEAEVNYVTDDPTYNTAVGGFNNTEYQVYVP